MKNLYPDVGLPDRMLKWVVCLMSVVALASGWYPAYAQNTSSRQNQVFVDGVIHTKFTNQPLPGATVTVKGGTDGAVADVRGVYRLRFDGTHGTVLEFRMMGMKTVEIVYRGQTNIDVELEVDVTDIEQIVVTGIYTRKSESYAGSAVSLSGEQLRVSSGQNVFQSIKNLDATLFIMDNLQAGSDPNSLPDMQMRGTSSFPVDAEIGVRLKGNYSRDPNQPLFILDGFETTVERIMDMNMNRIQSLTILKDAAAKALYGSKAANGVIIIETKQLNGDKPSITYEGRLSLEMPDLTSYNLTNALEKLEVERIEGVYRDGSGNPVTQFELDQRYNYRRKLALEGLDTYWLAKPLRTGIGQRHSLSVELGDVKSLRTLLDFQYNKTNGVMKGSSRESYSGNINVSYRQNNLLFRNIMSIGSVKGIDSPYGNFGDYAKMNPFWRDRDDDGNLVRWAEPGIANPLYDATIGTHIQNTYLQFTNNFYVEWYMTPDLKLTGRFGINAKRNDADTFYPALHSRFSSFSYQSGDGKLRRGEYSLENGKSSTISGDINANYNKVVNKHTIFANLGMQVSESVYQAYLHRAEGFPNNNNADITFARQYALNSRPQGSSSLNREMSFLLVSGYTYDNRYLFDLTFRESASSLYGKNNRWAPSWSVATGWNLHNESFLKGAEWLQQLKLRTSLGVTGNQNFDTNAAIGTYNYYTDHVYGGQTGAYLNRLPNPDLRWEQQQEFNAGMDFRAKRVSFRFDYYRADTKNMLTDLSRPTSTGFTYVKDNLGKVRNTGVEANLNYQVIQRSHSFLAINASIAHNKNYIVSLSESMRAENERRRATATEQGRSAPPTLYEDGQSMDVIWAVPSAGIDPMTGYEVYIRPDGSLTYTYYADDLVAAGNKLPKIRGIIGLNGEFKGFGFNISLNYRTGSDMYNQTLVDRVENIDVTYNVDRRVLSGRWQEPGQVTSYKNLGTYYEDGQLAMEKTKPTTRFVQKHNELNIGLISAYYDFPTRMIDKLGLQQLRLNFMIENVHQFSTIRIERGLAYPFARNMSFSLTATF